MFESVSTHEFLQKRYVMPCMLVHDLCCVLLVQMICKACNHIRDVDLCRDSHLLSDGNQPYVDAVYVFVQLVDI